MICNILYGDVPLYADSSELNSGMKFIGCFVLGDKPP
jgi:hypothetical protein